MTVNEAIAQADALKPGNQIGYEVKEAWLKKLEEQITREIVNTHEGGAVTDGSLAASGAYEDLYIYYLCAQADRTHEEFAKYNNDMIMFNSRYDEFAKEYHRRHMPKQVRITGV